MQAVERRRWRRVNCDAVGQGVLLRLETADSAAAVLNTYACDVSLGGLAFEVKKDITLPDPLPLKVFLPHARTPLDCSSRIAWQKLTPHLSDHSRSMLFPMNRERCGMNEQTAHIGVAFLQLAEEQHDTLKDFLQEVGAHPATVECAPVEAEEAKATRPPKQKPLPRGSRRDQAIWQFEQGVLLYHQRKLGQAKRAFQKVIRAYVDIIDVARVARRYRDWCEEEKEA